MKIYTLTVQSVNEDGTLDYSVINGVFQDKEAAKKFANDKLKEQAYFWKDSYTTKKSSDGYCTNDAKLAGNHSGRAVSANFRAIYKKLCPCDTEIGEVISHFSDWWGDGSGDMLFIRDEYVDAFTEWAKN